MNRYSYCWNKTQNTQEIRKLPRGFFRYQKYLDTIEHSCLEGETLFALAGKYYHEYFTAPALLYWILADFQPEPIIDPTIVFSAGTVIHIPSAKTLNLYLFSPVREPEFETW